MAASPFLTQAEYAAYLGVDRSTVSRWVSDGKVAFIETPGGTRKIPRSALPKVIKERVAEENRAKPHTIEKVSLDEGTTYIIHG